MSNKEVNNQETIDHIKVGLTRSRECFIIQTVSQLTCIMQVSYNKTEETGRNLKEFPLGFYQKIKNVT